MLFACAFALLAGVDGIGPSHNGVKVRCLTTWLYPHTVVFHHLYMHGTSLFPVFWVKKMGRVVGLEPTHNGATIRRVSLFTTPATLSYGITAI